MTRTKTALAEAKRLEMGRALVEALQSRRAERARRLIARGADARARGGGQETALHWAVTLGARLVEEVIAAGADVDARDFRGYTAAAWAANGGLEEALGALIRAGADLDLAALDGWTPAMMAARSREAGCLALLLEAGCDVERRNGRGPSARELAERDAPCLAALEAWLLRRAAGHAAPGGARRRKAL